MKKPFVLIGISFAVGVILSKYCSGLMSPVVAVAIVTGPLLWFTRGKKAFIPIFIFALVCAGFLGHRIQLTRPVHGVEGFASEYRCAVTGRVESLPDVRKRGRRISASFVLRVCSVDTGSRRYPRPRAANGIIRVFWIQPGVVPAAGDIVRLYGNLKKPKRALNPGQFDQARYLEGQGIFATLEVIGQYSGKVIAKAPWWYPARWIGEFRLKISEQIDTIYKKPASSILKALILGIRDDLGMPLRDAFMKTGTVHLLAISGLNITMIAGSFYVFFMMLGVGRKNTAGLTILIVIGYVILSGSGIPVRRAGSMAIIALLAVIFGRPTSPLNTLGAAFFLTLIVSPEDLWNIGFQLSYLSVFALIAIFPFFPKSRIFSFSIGGSLAVMAGTFPVVLYYFNVFSPVSVAANLVAIPVFDAALFLSFFSLFLFRIPWVGEILIMIASVLVRIGLEWIQKLSGAEWGYWFFLKPVLWQLIGYYTGLAGLIGILPRHFTGKRWVVTVLLVLCLVTGLTMLRGETDRDFSVTVLAAGRDPVIHVRFTGGKDWLINTGRRFPSDQGERLVLPYLRRRGIKKLGGILLTDAYKRHTGGLSAILRDVSVEQIVFPESLPVPPELQTSGFRVKRLGNNQTVSGTGESESLYVDGQAGKNAIITILSKSKKICFVPKGTLTAAPPDGIVPDLMILPYLKEPVPEEWFQSVRFWILSGGEPELIEPVKKVPKGVYLLSKTGALEIRIEGLKISVSPYL